MGAVFIKYPSNNITIVNNKTSKLVLILKRCFGKKPINPVNALNKPTTVVPPKKQFFKNDAAINKKNASTEQSVNNPSSTSATTGVTKKEFFKHNAIKDSINPYKVAPKKTDIPLPELSFMERVYKRFGFNSFKELLYGPQTNYRNISELSKPSTSISKELVVAESLNPSPHCPKQLTDIQYFRATLAATFTFNKKCGMPNEANATIGTYSWENSGQNFQVLQVIAKNLKLANNLNILPYFPKDMELTLPYPMYQKLKNLPLTGFGLATEAIACNALNKSFTPPFTLFNPMLKITGDVYNNTGQTNPDFIRQITLSNGTLVNEMFDLKSSILGLKQLDQVRLVSNNSLDVLNEAHQQVFNSIKMVQKNVNISADRVITATILKQLTAIQLHYQQTLDVNQFRISYNAIRSNYAEFFIQHNIPMNLIVNISLENFLLDPYDISFFQQVFSEFYYSPTSPVIQLVHDYLAENNHEIIDFTKFLQYLAKRLMESEDF